jgi:hypothetical protein
MFSRLVGASNRSQAHARTTRDSKARRQVSSVSLNFLDSKSQKKQSKEIEKVNINNTSRIEFQANNNQMITKQA